MSKIFSEFSKNPKKILDICKYMKYMSHTNINEIHSQ